MNDTVDNKPLHSQPEMVKQSERSLLEEAVSATKQTTRDETLELLKNLTQEAAKGTVTWDKSLMKTINNAIKGIDAIISKQLAAIMHHETFSKLEGGWRGLHYFVSNTETSGSLKIKLLPVSKRDLLKDLTKAVEFDQSILFKKLYENEFGTPGGEPYGALLGDMEFTNHPEDLDLLSGIAGVAAAAFCPFIASAAPQQFGFDNWSELSKPRDLAKIFDGVDYAKWRSFRDSEDSRFVTLTMPRVLARLPYGKATRTIDAFDYEEAPINAQGRTTAMQSDEFCWMNASYVLGTKLTHAFSKYGWCTAIRGAEGGGRVDNLPLYPFVSDDGDTDLQCPTEIGITDRREAELSRLGFLPLCHYKNTDYAVYFGAQTTQKPKQYDRPEATANAEISSRLPYIMATSRFAHYLKVIGRDKIGSFMEASDVEAWLNRWILNYVNSNASAGQDMKASLPLADAKIQVREIPGKPGAYHAVAWLKPWLQLEELTTSMRLVANIPSTK